MPHEIMIVGAGKIGSAIAKMLGSARTLGEFDYSITVVDSSQAALDKIRDLDVANSLFLWKDDGTDESIMSLAAMMAGKRAVLSACTFTANKTIASAACEAGISYFDLTEDVECTKFVRKLAYVAQPGQIYMPQCGLAPGFIGIVGHDLGTRFDKIDTLELRVGALPMFPTNMLKYNLTWSTDGLINEYCNPCYAVVEGNPVEVPALEGLEKFSLEGIEYECFNTSGGLGTLCETLKDKVRTLNYKTIRYPGHRDLMDFLLNHLRFRDRRDLLREIFETALPLTQQDVIVIFATAKGWKDGKYIQKCDLRQIRGGRRLGREDWTGIQLTTAAGICAVLDMHLENPFASKGFVRQEQVPLDRFLDNRFGFHYKEIC